LAGALDIILELRQGGKPGGEAVQAAEAAGLPDLSFEAAGAAGYASVAIRLPWRSLLDCNEAACIELAKRAARAGVRVGTLVVETDGKFDLVEAGLAATAASVASGPPTAGGSQPPGLTGVIDALDRAAWLGAGQVILPPVEPHGDAAGPVRSYDDAVGAALAALLALRFESQRRTVEIAVRLSARGICRSPSEARDFFDAVNSPWIGAAIDIVRAPADSEVQAAVDMIASLRHRLRAVRWQASPPGGVGAKRGDPTPGECFARALNAARFGGTIVYTPDEGPPSPFAPADWAALRHDVI
jgi:sugar phosphate isomerase/epimerase